MVVGDLALVLPELFMAVLAMLVLVLGAVWGSKDQTPLFLVAGIGVLVAAVLLLTADSGRATAFEGFFLQDAYSGLGKGLILIASIAALAISVKYLQNEELKRAEYPALMLLSVLGMMLLLSSNDFLTAYVGIELQSLCLYILAAFRKKNTKSTEAGVKYFVLGALASVVFLYGVSLIYGFTGTTGFAEVKEALNQEQALEQTGLLFGVAFVVCGLAFKISAVPFHMWTPDVYEGAPTPVTAFFSVAPKIAGLLLLGKVLFSPFAGVAVVWQDVITALAVLSMAIGAFGALRQDNMKRLLAYSSISHVGFCLIAVASNSAEGISALFIYLITYAITSLGAFGVLLALRKSNRYVETVDDLKGLSQSHPVTALCMSIILLSMAGIPPLAGFFGKFYVFMAAIDAGLIGLAIAGILVAVVTVFYYLRIIKVMYFEEGSMPLTSSGVIEVKTVTWTSALLAGGFVLVINSVVDITQGAAAAFFAG